VRIVDQPSPLVKWAAGLTLPFRRPPPSARRLGRPLRQASDGGSRWLVSLSRSAVFRQNCQAAILFTTDGERPFSGYSKAKAKFDADCGVTGWTLHDLRRTARSLMSRASVSADVAERCLGHVISGVRGTYDRHAYFDEKKRAFEALAALIDRIVNPPADNVVSLEGYLGSAS
jgi:integrase